jgi:exopolyphosphatase/guanosine-5'-triphosphate,3'-diphosphate pyrophosphatase
VELDLEQRLAMPGLDPRRADLIVAGVILVDTLLRRLGAEDITLCDLALREGLVLEYIRTHRREIAQIDAIPDVRRRSTVELAQRCQYDRPHAEHVVRLSLALFDQTRHIHSSRIASVNGWNSARCCTTSGRISASRDTIATPIT